MDDCDDGLSAGFGSSTDVMGERTRHFDLQSSYVSDCDAEDTTQRHHRPEVGAFQIGEVVNDRELAHEEKQRGKQEDSIEIVIQLQAPYVAFHNRHHTLRVYCIKTDKQGAKNTEK